MILKPKLGETLYDIVADEILAFCEKTYYSDIVVSFEQSYDGKEWSKETEFATFDSDFFDSVVFNMDWNEGQTYLRNLRIWHLRDCVSIIRCRDCTYWDNKFQKRLKDGSIKKKYCTATERMTNPDFFCAYGENERGHNIDTET